MYQPYGQVTKGGGIRVLWTHVQFHYISFSRIKQHPQLCCCTCTYLIHPLSSESSRSQAFDMNTPLNPTLYKKKVGYAGNTLFFLFLPYDIDCGLIYSERGVRASYFF